MSLLDFFEDDTPERDTEAISELIRRRRRQMVIHSYLYYRMDMPVISDNNWQSWADELATLQKENVDLMEQDVYDDVFEDWDGSTGMHLPATGAERSCAEYLSRICNEGNMI